MSYINRFKQRLVPTSGQTIVINTVDADVVLILEPAGTLATLILSLTIVPEDGQQFTVFSSKAITALTINGATLVPGITTIAANGFATYTYDASQSKFYRTG